MREINLDDSNLPELTFFYMANGSLLPIHLPTCWSDDWLIIAKGLAETHEWWLDGGGWFSFHMAEPANVIVSICFIDSALVQYPTGFEIFID